MERVGRGNAMSEVQVFVTCKIPEPGPQVLRNADISFLVYRGDQESASSGRRCSTASAGARCSCRCRTAYHLMPSS